MIAAPETLADADLHVGSGLDQGREERVPDICTMGYACTSNTVFPTVGDFSRFLAHFLEDHRI